MLGYNLTTKQTTGDGLRVDALLVAEGVKITKEMYLAFLIDRANQKSAIIASKYGGMNIEEVAEKDPNAIITTRVCPKAGLTDADLDNIVKGLEIENSPNAKEQLKNMYNMFTSIDSTQLEINPWGLNDKNETICVDAKVGIDDNAEFRQKEIVDMKANSLAAE